MENMNNRDDILERNRRSSPKDEGEQYVQMRARRWGEIGLLAFFVLIMVYKIAKNIPANDSLAVIWGYLGARFIGEYSLSHDRRKLVSGICGCIAAVCFAIAYVCATW